MRKTMPGTGWKVNHTAVQTAAYAQRLKDPAGSSGGNVEAVDGLDAEYAGRAG